MNYRRYLLFVLICCFLISPVFASELDKKLNALTKQIIDSITKNNKTTIAVIEFSIIDGKITALGKSIAEELTTKLFMTNKFEVVERELLNKILAEHKLNLSGLVDPGSAKELGMILGVNAIVSGTITELDKNVRINARLIETETGSIFSVAAVEMKKDEDIKKLLVQVITEPTNKSNLNTSNITSTETPPTETQTANPGEVKVSKEITINTFLKNEAHAFTDPILATITNNTPDFHEDFSDPKSGMNVGKQKRGEAVYLNGKYSLIANPSTGEWRINSSKIPRLLDFVIEFDIHYISGATGGTQFDLRDWRDISHDGRTSITIGNNGYVRIWTDSDSDFDGKDQILYETDFGTPFHKWKNEFNHLVIIIKDSRIAVLINGEVAGFIKDYIYPREIINGGINMVFFNQGASLMKAEIDNLKIWDLAKFGIK